jgi:hypothetical protein
LQETHRRQILDPTGGSSFVDDHAALSGGWVRRAEFEDVLSPVRAVEEQLRPIG